MTKQELDQLKAPLPNWLESKGLDLRRNFACLNPDHDDSSPSMAYYKKTNQVVCFGCGKTYDLLDLIGIAHNTGDFKQQAAIAKDIYGSFTFSLPATKAISPPPEPDPDYSKEIQAYHADLKKTDYFTKRGIGEGLQSRFRLGFSAKDSAIVIPVSNSYYITRKTDQKAFRNYGKVQPFNMGAFNQDKPVFITESAIDALSIMELGFEAIALNGMTHTAPLIDHLKKQKAKLPLLILTLDNDTAGISAADELSAQFMALGFEHSKPILPKWYEDANQSLKLHTSDFRALLSDLAKTEQKQEAAMQKKTENQPKLPEKAKASNVNNNLDFFFTGTCNDNPISTGFSNLDDLLDGGLREGLYIIGAGSALGKTTFCLQLANRAAASGQSVAFLSLEQSRQELIAKTLSMLTYADPSNGGQEVCTAREVKRYALLPPGNKKALNNAKEKLTEYGNNLFIYEIDDQDQSVSELVLSHELETGSAPAVLIIDYLQIMKPSRIGITSDKQIIDANVHELRQLARRHKIPIIAISSLNRIAYDQGLSFKSFKESGGIEYSSDLLLGLQPKGSRQDSTMDDFLRNDSREMELVLLKNRNGSTGKCQFMFKAKYNFFKEMQ